MNSISIGTQTFSSIQEAIDSIPDDGKFKLIQLGPGEYHEKIYLKKTGVTLKGAGADKTHVVFGDYAKMPGKDGLPINTFETFTFFLGADKCRLEDLSIENNAGPGSKVGQAVALYVDGDQCVIKNCRLTGRQDTLFLAPLPPKPAERSSFGGPRSAAPRKSNRIYFLHSKIQGDIDFIFGGATAVFDHCHIHSLSHSGDSYITAASTPGGNKHGLVFINCLLTGDAQPKSVYLGRPWREHAKTVFISCDYGAHIHSAGWHDWNKDNARSTTYYREAKGRGPGYQPEERVDWAGILSDKELSSYTIEKIFPKSDFWKTSKGEYHE